MLREPTWTFRLAGAWKRCAFGSLLTAVVALLPVSVAWSQTPAPIHAAAAPAAAAYDPRVAFAPLTLPDPVNAYRSGNGAPGPAYWQNEADYEMHAALDTNAKTLQNDETINLHQQQS